MGMFSWVCKGCGHELCEGEFVRLNGRAGEYDGYGRVQGGLYDYDQDYEGYGQEPVAWHQACLKRATLAQKRDLEASRPAPNQGMGHAKLEFRREYDPKAKTVYDFGFYCHTDEGRHQFHLTDKGLEDNEAWWNAIRKGKEMADMGKSPSERSVSYETFEECLKIAESYINKLPTDAYTLTIFGTQEKVCGAVYIRQSDHQYEKPVSEYFKLHVPFEEWKRLPTNKIAVVYERA